MKAEFQKELTKQGFVFQETSYEYYKVRPKNRIVRPISFQLVVSRPINQIIHGSQNGNELSGIGYFLFSLNSENNPDYIVFTFKHLRNESAQLIIIPSEELCRRLKKNIIRFRSGENLELRLWLLDDHIYDTTSMGLEGEWYYLSKGRGGRMIDGTVWDFTQFLNNWVLGPGD